MRDPDPAGKLPRNSLTRNGVFALGLALLVVLVLAGFAQLTWVFVPVGIGGLFVFEYFGVTLERSLAKALCWGVFLAILATLGMFYWAVLSLNVFETGNMAFNMSSF
jgi:hypothetical protein